MQQINMEIILGVFEEGFLYAIMALGVYITYKILDFPDLSVDGTFPLGGAVAAALISRGVNAALTLPIAFCAGILAGMITGIIHVKLKVRDLLSGIIVSTALYSVNLRIAGKSNLPIFSQDNIFENEFTRMLPEQAQVFVPIVLLFVLVLFCKILLDLFLQTRSGYLLRAVGDNEILVSSLARDKGKVKILGLAIANGFVALAGCVLVQKSGAFDISSGTGTIVIGLADVIIGTQLFKNFGVIKATSAVLIGSVIYKACVSLALSSGLSFVLASDLKAITAVLFLVILVLSENRKKKARGLIYGKAEKKI